MQLTAYGSQDVYVNAGDIADGYRDGYYDSHQRWHRWAHPDDWKAYSRAHSDRYHGYSHNDPHQ